MPNKAGRGTRGPAVSFGEPLVQQDPSLDGFSQAGTGRWGVDGILTLRDEHGPDTGGSLVDLGEDGSSRITQLVGPSTQESYDGFFSDGSSISMNATYGEPGGILEVISPDGLSIFGVEYGAICAANGDGTIEFPIDLLALPSPTGSYAAQPGETLNFQVWFRDSDPSGAPTSNFTDAVALTVE